MNLYGWLVMSVIASNIGLDIMTPEIIIETLFAYLLFFDMTYKPMIVGIKNTTTNPSNLNWYASDTNPFQNPFQSHSFVVWVSNVVAPTIIIVSITKTRIIFFFTEISASNIKNIDMGKNVMVSGFENRDVMYATGDKNHVLCTVRYSEIR